MDNNIQTKALHGYTASVAADPVADIELVNRYTVKELTPDEVFCFNVALCDNENDRDVERFSDDTLEQMAGKFAGVTGISDHSMSAKQQFCRIYRAYVETLPGKTSYGAPKKCLMASAYVVKSQETEDIIKKIEGGILKEVSVGVRCAKRSCSVCGEEIERLDYWRGNPCRNGHQRGTEYGGKTCVHVLSDLQDVFEFSFVPVPAQPGAGVTKSFEIAKNLKEFADFVASSPSELREAMPAETLKAMQLAITKALEPPENQLEREQILAQNKQFLTGGSPNL